MNWGSGGGGQVVNPCLNPVVFFVKMFEKNENKQKETGDGPF